ncbi:isochorismatase family protein [Paracoccus onubensis]|uniref:isochorismatase family protein n=1 Tax=Paracoccus onubensis TaxID=1675788 RepID=UPI0027318E60|nr:isochorismatase family protein [Paracoccus onubensis]MDP0926608.1 isochorismatase family protein [Paracoccus onubensis]
MTERVWDKFLTERDKQVFKLAGYGVRQGFGTRPALLVIDVNYAFCGDRREPLLESVKRWRQSGGEAAWDALPVIRKLIDVAHDRELPVIYTTGIRRADNWDAGGWAWKNARSGEKPKAASAIDGNEIMPQIAPSEQDIVIHKQKPSGFHGTNLLSYLTLLGCDSVIVTGTATSGCVRATVVDAFSYNYRVTMVEDACFERSEASHAIALCDLNAKYADVIGSEEVLAFMQERPRGMFDLPKGPALRAAE